MSEMRRSRRTASYTQAGDSLSAPAFAAGSSSKRTLTEYMQQLIELESSILTQNNLIKLYNEKAELRKPVEPEPPNVPEPAWAAPPDADGYRSAVVFACVGIGICAGFIILFFICMIETNMFVTSPYLSLMMMGVMGMIGYFIYLFGAWFGKEKREMEEQEARYEAYNRQKEANKALEKQLDEEYAAAKEQYDADMEQWTQSNAEVLHMMNTSVGTSKGALDALYSLGWIYPKYRNLPALTSICEYFVTGRCSELAGPYGAYNLYEDEVRKDTVISQLNTVIENLEKIKQNQYMLYEQVKSIQYYSYRIACELSEIKGYTVNIAELTALNTYYASVTAKSTKALAYYHFLLG